MLSDDARNAFDDAHRIAEEMRGIHAHEKHLQGMKGRLADKGAIAALDKELVELRSQWTMLASLYAEAVGRFTKANDEARREREREARRK